MGLSDACGVDDVAEGGMLCRTLGDQRVVICRVQGEIYAVNALCTHERAYLDEGVLDGFMLYCPLHYSTFDVRTGEVVAPPADRGVLAYPVVIKEGRVLVDTDPSKETAREAPGASTPKASRACGGTGSARPPTATASEAPPRAVQPAVSGGEESVKLLERLLATVLRSQRVEWATGVTHSATTRLRSKLRSGDVGTWALDLLHGRVGLGHPLHPAATDVPIGLWAAASVVDLMSGRDRVALTLGGVGAAGAAVSVASGVADWSVTDGMDRRIGFVHGAINLVAFGAQGLALYARAKGRHRIAVPCGLVSVALVAASGYLGGHLVLGRGVMVDHTAWHVGPLDWENVVRVEELPPGRACVTGLSGRRVLVYRQGENFYAIDGACSHAGAVLSPHVMNGVAECPLHGSRFRVKDGAVVCGPATFAQPTLEVKVEDGWVAVRGRRG